MCTNDLFKRRNKDSIDKGVNQRISVVCPTLHWQMGKGFKRMTTEGKKKEERE